MYKRTHLDPAKKERPEQVIPDQERVPEHLVTHPFPAGLPRVLGEKVTILKQEPVVTGDAPKVGFRPRKVVSP